MGKRRNSTPSTPLEEVLSPPSLAEPNNSSTLKPPRGPSTRQLSPDAAKTTPSKKAKSTHEATSKASSPKNAKATSGGSRRSSRLRNVGESPSHTTPNKEIERIIEDITNTDSEKEEDEQPPVVGETQGEKSSEELGKLCEEQEKIIAEQQKSIAEQQKSIAELKAEISKNALPNERPSDLKYKSLYIDSKNEVDALTKETHQLRTEIEFVRGRAAGLGEAMMTMLVAVARTGFWGTQPQQ